MVSVMKIFALVFILFTHTKYLCADKPCAVRPIEKQSVVCVCNSTYCDDVIRNHPAYGTFVIYTSSQSGLRFKKSVGHWSDNLTSSKTTLYLDPSKQYQRIEGFGGSVTDSAAINWRSLSPVLQDYLIKSYFSENGLEYNMVRTPIGGSDFSVRPYAYNELPWGDARLTNFTFSPEDILYKIPMFKSIFKVAKTPIHIVATTWSPPPWMKTNQNYSGFSQLKPEYYQTYADYHLKFLEMYNAAGVPIWGITTTNEPINGIFGLAPFNSLGWTMREMGKWIEQNLGPTIRNSTFSNVKIITGDDQRLTIPYWFNVMLTYHPKALDYIDGLGVHYYTDKFVPPQIFDTVTLTHPEKFILATEACEGSFPWETQKVLLGSWNRAKSYIIDIFQDLNFNLVGWIDWNLCLDKKGGPNWASNYVDSPIIVDKDRQEFVKQPMFYAMGHFSKFVPRDSVRIEITEKQSFLPSSLHKTAFLTPRNTIVAIIYNDGSERTIDLQNGKRHAMLPLEAHSITTVEFSHTYR
ncbi:lysosomal acid glucosylceramidase-like [Maniola hyperantus]|uniref:lysosomal acid glucosylceramidase-like n=1 Tax=Aphantopus hyperantus TaxID=2795564 RepID=UPI00156A6B06|nr:lysosomal acid glucosylceramidase-like [Maniola hyperantus]XP_034827998.1 lysosomal acid glucosylceramidase-like [Maniola hyperantus]